MHVCEGTSWGFGCGANGLSGLGLRGSGQLRAALPPLTCAQLLPCRRRTCKGFPVGCEALEQWHAARMWTTRSGRLVLSDGLEPRCLLAIAAAGVWFLADQGLVENAISPCCAWASFAQDPTPCCRVCRTGLSHRAFSCLFLAHAMRGHAGERAMLADGMGIVKPMACVSLHWRCILCFRGGNGLAAQVQKRKASTAYHCVVLCCCDDKQAGHTRAPQS